MNLIINNKLKPFLIFIFSFLYLNFYFLIINNNFKEDFFNNRTNISYIWPHTLNFTNILYFRIAAFINNIINNPEQTIIIIGSVLYQFIFIFLKYNLLLSIYKFSCNTNNSSIFYLNKQICHIFSINYIKY